VFSADAMPASESVMVCFSSQSASSAESGSDSVNCLSTNHHYLGKDKDRVPTLLCDENNTIFGQRLYRYVHIAIASNGMLRNICILQLSNNIHLLTITIL